MSEKNIDAEVLIVGAGPAGLMLANMLGMYGRSVIVLEERDDLIDFPRGVGIDDESLRTIQTIGLTEEVLPHTTPQHIMRLVDGSGRTMLVNDPKTTVFGWGRKHGFIQPEVDRVLCNGLDRFDTVDIRFGHRITDVTEDADGVVATVETTPDAVAGTPSTYSLRGQYLVGCEGGRSETRKRIGVEFTGGSPPTRWLVVDVNNDPLGTPNVFLGADPRRPYVSIGLPHGVRRWEFMLHKDEDAEQMLAPDTVASLLKDHVPDPENLDVIRHRVFTHHGRVASSFRRGRQLIAGDAAHLMPVWMGQGWNSCIRDATNLGWKLAAVLSGQAGDKLLETYTSERRDHAQAMVDLSMTFGSVIKITNPVAAAARDAAARVLNYLPSVKSYFAEMRFKPMPRYHQGVLADAADFSSGRAAESIRRSLIPVKTSQVLVSPVGTMFPQPDVMFDDQVRKFDDVLGTDWAVVVWGNDPAQVLPERSLRLLRRLEARLAAVVPETQRLWSQDSMSPDTMVLGDSTGALKTWFDDRPSPVVFLRPDRFVAGASLIQEAPKTLDAILKAMSFQGAA